MAGRHTVVIMNPKKRIGAFGFGWDGRGQLSREVKATDRPNPSGPPFICTAVGRSVGPLFSVSLSVCVCARWPQRLDEPLFQFWTLPEKRGGEGEAEGWRRESRLVILEVQRRGGRRGGGGMLRSFIPFRTGRRRRGIEGRELRTQPGVTFAKLTFIKT